MSDFLFSSTTRNHGELTRDIRSIYHEDAPEVLEYHGSWGSLGVSRNLYNGFQVMETDLNIFVVIGGPVLNFADNQFLTDDDPTRGTRQIFKHYETGIIQWDEDISGPFVILSVNKEKKTITCITDLMMFIPVYHYFNDGKLVLGTHVDTVAKAAFQEESIDYVSLADFVINDVITFPYTAYVKIRQLDPAALHHYKFLEKKVQASGTNAYWIPREKNIFKNIHQASVALREGIKSYINKVTGKMDNVAQFISAGEDSRAVAGMLPRSLKKEAYIFLKKMNLEGKIAKKAARAYRLDFTLHFFGETRYLDILPEASDLVGSGHQYIHSLSLGPHKKYKLERFPAFFGGFLSDTLLKGHHIKLIKGSGYFIFLPDIPAKRVSPIDRHRAIAEKIFPELIHKAISERQGNHLKKIKELRPLSYKEWFHIWPLSMHKDMPHLHCNRRLFRSYEPFMSNNVVKISASVPASWKLNRRLFQKAMHPYLKSSKWLFHSKGFMPFFPWWVNILPQCGVWIYRKITTLAGITESDQESLVDWEAMMSTREMREAVELYDKNQTISDRFLTIPPKEMMRGKALKTRQKFNLLQVMYTFNSKNHR